MAIQIDRAIFLHIPKTGGTWITNYFKETNMDHGDGQLGLHAHINGKVIRAMKDPIDDVVFCFVRHPLTWYRSYWQMKKDLVSKRHGGWIDTIVDQPFHDFIKTVIEMEPGYLTSFFEGYTERSRLIGKQESLREDLDDILRLLSIKYDRHHLFEKPKENSQAPYATYSHRLAKLLMDSEKDLITKYNYNYIPDGVLDV